MKQPSLRYDRQTRLVSFGADGQEKLTVGRVLVVGLGGLGLPVVQYLNAMGVGTLGIIDNDTIDLTNLQRQVLYNESDVGKSKLEVTLEKLQEQNSETVIHSIPAFLNVENALEIIKGYDVVVDATDNFATRYLINDACVLLNKPFVYGALHGFEGQVSVFNHQDGPTYRCLFPKMPKADEVPNCDENGVLGVLPGIIGTLQALEVVKILTAVGEVLSGKLLLYDGWSQSTRKISFETNPANKQITKLAASYSGLPCKVDALIDAETYLAIDTEHLLLDVRTAEEFRQDHLPKAQNKPLDELLHNLGGIATEKPIYLICQSGKRSQIAYEALTTQFPKVELYQIKGGMNEIVPLSQ